MVGLGSALVFERALNGSNQRRSKLAICWSRCVRRYCCRCCAPYVLRRGASTPKLPINMANVTVAEKNWMAERKRHRFRVCRTCRNHHSPFLVDLRDGPWCVVCRCRVLCVVCRCRVLFAVVMCCAVCRRNVLCCLRSVIAVVMRSACRRNVLCAACYFVLPCSCARSWSLVS